MSRGFAACAEKSGGAGIASETVSDKLFGSFRKHAERGASTPYKGKPNLVTGDWNRLWNAAHNGRAALWSQAFFCLIK